MHPARFAEADQTTQGGRAGLRPGKALFFALLFSRSVFDGTVLGLGHRIAILLFVQSKLALNSRFFVKHFPDRG